jgi:hypothetical protein
MCRVIAICFCILLVACQRLADRKFVGEWQAGCDADFCADATLNADHTFSVKFDQKTWVTNYAGTWRTEKDELVAHVISAGKGLEDLIGKDLRIKVSEFHHDHFMATIVEEGNTSSGMWKRVR